MSDWQDLVVGDRMSVDQQFNDRLRQSEFNSQEWGLIMTATEFQIEAPGDPDRARIVANTEKLPSIMPELKNLQDAMGGMGGAPGGSGDRGGAGGGGGLFDSIKGALGLDGDGGDEQERIEAAERLTQEYAEALQRHLEENGKWDTVREHAAADGE
jgi:hypothetical protein